MSTEYLRQLAESSATYGGFIWEISRFYEAFHHAAGVPEIYVHDSSAVAYLLRPELFTTRSGAIRVLTEGIGFGQTIQKPDGVKFPPSAWDGRPSHKVCVEVDAEGLRRLYRATIAG